MLTGYVFPDGSCVIFEERARDRLLCCSSAASPGTPGGEITRGAAVPEEAPLSSALKSAISPETEIPRSSAGAEEMLMLRGGVLSREFVSSVMRKRAT